MVNPGIRAPLMVAFFLQVNIFRVFGANLDQLFWKAQSGRSQTPAKSLLLMFVEHAGADWLYQLWDLNAHEGGDDVLI